jgi:hypothetical protein
MLYQPRELWQYEAALFHCDQNEMKAYMLKKVEMSKEQSHDFVVVEEVARANRDELQAILPLLRDNEGKTADESFTSFVENIFDKRVISSVFLTGIGFEEQWYPNALKVITNGRRGFQGNNLYSKGACYAAHQRMKKLFGGPIYLDETKLCEQISLRMRVNGKEGWYPIVSYGTPWYEADGKIEVILEDVSDVEVHIKNVISEDIKVQTISLEGLTERKDYSLRIQLEIRFLDEVTCNIILKDIGFGDFFEPSDFEVEKIIHLGGHHGQFDFVS